MSSSTKYYCTKGCGSDLPLKQVVQQLDKFLTKEELDKGFKVFICVVCQRVRKVRQKAVVKTDTIRKCQTELSGLSRLIKKRLWKIKSEVYSLGTVKKLKDILQELNEAEQDKEGDKDENHSD
jgi:hypothetical protein